MYNNSILGYGPTLILTIIIIYYLYNYWGLGRYYHRHTGSGPLERRTLPQVRLQSDRPRPQVQVSYHMHSYCDRTCRDIDVSWISGSCTSHAWCISRQIILENRSCHLAGDVTESKSFSMLGKLSWAIEHDEQAKCKVHDFYLNSCSILVTSLFLWSPRCFCRWV